MPPFRHHRLCPFDVPYFSLPVPLRWSFDSYHATTCTCAAMHPIFYFTCAHIDPALFFPAVSLSGLLWIIITLLVTLHAHSKSLSSRPSLVPSCPPSSHSSHQQPALIIPGFQATDPPHNSRALNCAPLLSARRTYYPPAPAFSTASIATLSLSLLLLSSRCCAHR